MFSHKTALARGDWVEVCLSTRANTFPIYQTVGFSTASAEQEHRIWTKGEKGAFIYSRTDNPTVRGLEFQLARLEQADDALLFSSGMAAIFVVFATALRPGDRAVVSRAVYPGTRDLLKRIAPRWGWKIDFIDLHAARTPFKPDTHLIFAESISNPYAVLCDVAAVARQRGRRKITLCIDNTYASPLNYQPLREGADIVVESATKSLSGHEDVLAGVFAGSQDRCDEVGIWRALLGLTPHAFEAFLVQRGLKTFPLRAEMKCASAEKVARHLAQHRAVKRVYYLGLEDHPQHTRARQLMRQFGSVVTIDLGDARRVRRAIRRMRLLTCSMDTGGTASYCYPWQDDPNILRLSIDIEDVRDIIRDIDYALN